MKIKIGPNGRMPKQHYPGDAGFDLYVSENVWVEPGEFADVATDVFIQLPTSYWGQVVGRSSTLKNRGLMVVPGVIDNGYRGELFTGVWNLSGETRQIHRGDRIAQFIPTLIVSDRLSLEQVEHLDEHVRGLASFGSSGV